MNDYELLYYIHQNDELSFNYLVDNYRRYIYYIINLFHKKYYFFGYDDQDLFNEAIILLNDCVYTYRDDLNVKFSSYFIACLKRRYLYLIRNLANNKNRGHALALSLDSNYAHDDLDLYNIIPNYDIAVNEKANNNYLIEKAFEIMKNNLNELEKNIIYYYIKGYSYKEIETIIKVNTKKIDNTIQKYRKLVVI